MPDSNYYTDQSPYVDEKRLRAEVERGEETGRSRGPAGLQHTDRLHVNCEDYVDYKYLDGPIYESGDRHLARSPSSVSI